MASGAHEKHPDAFRAALESALPVGVATIDMSGHQAFVNEQFASMVGYAPEELIGRAPPFPYWPAERHAELQERIGGMLNRSGGATATETEFCRKNGERFAVELVTAPLESADGSRHGWLACVTDISQRKKTLIALEHSEARFRALVELAPSGIGIAVDGRVAFVNSAAARILGAKSTDDLVGKSVIELVHPSERERAAQNIGSLARGEGPMPLTQHTFLRLDGTSVPVRIAATSTTFRGEPAIQVGFHDESEIEREHSELLALRKAVETSREIVFVTDFNGIIKYVNPEFTRVYGWSAEEIVGKTTPRVLKSGLLPNEVYEHFWALITSGQVAEGELKNRTKDGRLVDIDGSANPIFGEDGSIVGFLALQRDVTGRRAEARESQLTQLAIDRSREAVLRFDAHGRITYANESAAELLGCAPSELLGAELCSVDPFVAERGWDRFWKELGELRARTRRTTLQTKNGGSVAVEVSSSVHELEGEPFGFAFIRDLRERDSLQAQLQHAQKMEAVGRLAGGVAHDFNNILSVILTYAGFIHEELQASDPMREDIEEVLKAVRRATGLARQLLIFSRRDVVRPQPTDLGEVLSQMERLLGRTLGEDVSLVTQPAANLWTVMVDPAQIEQVLVNLAVNARDAMPDGGRLTISTGNVELTDGRADLPAGRYVEVTVEDTGSGMSEDVASHVFEPFFTTKPKAKGTGLGLSMVYGIVKQAGGDVTVSSTPGTGTKFRIVLPTVEASVTTEPPPSATESEEAGGTVLVVEDEDSVRAAIVRILERAGYEVFDAANAGEALLICERQGSRVDLLLTDVVMPWLSGKELADRLQKLAPDLRVVFTSGHAENELVHAGQVPPETTLLEKPITREALLSVVRKALRRPAPAK